MGLQYGENVILLTSTVSLMIHPSERQTDGRAIAYTRAIACMLSRVKTTDFTHPSLVWDPARGNPLEFLDKT